MLWKHLANHGQETGGKETAGVETPQTTRPHAGSKALRASWLLHRWADSSAVSGEERSCGSPSSQG